MRQRRQRQPEQYREIEGFLHGRYLHAEDREGERRAREQLAKLLMSDEPLSRSIRTQLGYLFLPNAQLRLNLALGPPLLSHAFLIAIYITQQINAGIGVDAAVAAAERQFCVSRASAYRAWAKNRARANTLAGLFPTDILITVAEEETQRRRRRRQPSLKIRGQPSLKIRSKK